MRRRRPPVRPGPLPVIRADIIPPEELAAVRPWEADAHRPHPAANAWPDDAVLLTYAELRRLVAFHLDQAWQGMPNRDPWLWVRRRAAAMRDGETPLLLAEVMDR